MKSGAEKCSVESGVAEGLIATTGLEDNVAAPDRALLAEYEV